MQYFIILSVTMGKKIMYNLKKRQKCLTTMMFTQKFTRNVVTTNKLHPQTQIGAGNVPSRSIECPCMQAVPEGSCFIVFNFLKFYIPCTKFPSATKSDIAPGQIQSHQASVKYTQNLLCSLVNAAVSCNRNDQDAYTSPTLLCSQHKELERQLEIPCNNCVDLHMKPIDCLLTGSREAYENNEIQLGGPTFPAACSKHYEAFKPDAHGKQIQP